MTISILRHFVLVLFVPVAGFSLAWFGPAFASDIGFPMATTYLYLSVALFVVLLVIAAWLSETLAPLCGLAAVALTVAASLPLYLLMSSGDFADLGNLFDFVGVCAVLLFVAVATFGIGQHKSGSPRTRHSKRHIPDEIKRNDQRIAAGYGYPKMSSAAAHQLWSREMKDRGVR